MSEQHPDAGPDDVPAEVPDTADPDMGTPIAPTPLDEDDSQVDETGLDELDALLADDDA